MCYAGRANHRETIVGEDIIGRMTREQLEHAALSKSCCPPGIQAQLSAIHDHLYDLSLAVERLAEEVRRRV